jgi:hypothetical protein
MTQSPVTCTRCCKFRAKRKGIEGTEEKKKGGEGLT